jgi:hypothetical protein
MANHAYVVPEQLPSIETIDADIRAIVGNKFPMFQVEHNPDQDLWWINLNGDANFSLQCWIGEHWEDYDEKTDDCKTKIPCIEFRHGHCCQMLWWIEDEIRNALAAKYQAKQYDDGIGDYTPSVEYNSEIRTYNTFHDYVDSFTNSSEWRNLMLEEHREFLPDALKVLFE